MSAVDVLDLVLVLLLVAYAGSGFRQGLLVGLLSLGGFVFGAVAGVLLLPELVQSWSPGPERSLVVLVGTLVLAGLVQGLLGRLGVALRQRVTWEPARALDAATGLLGGVLAAALVLWVVAGAVRVSPFPVAAQLARESRVVTTLDQVVPDDLAGPLADFYSSVSGELFPQVFARGVPEPSLPVAEPDAAVLGGPGVAAAADGIVRVIGVAEACNRGQEGSGFVVAPGRVVTNAHVVAGMDRPSVQAGGAGELLGATVVVFDPARDLAVLDVPGLPLSPLPLGSDLARDDDAVVAGYPLNGPYLASAGRVRDVITAVGRDIYAGSEVTREVYSLNVQVRPGNSGGPVLDASGAVVGVVFARSLDDASTGYAVTLEEAADVLAVAGTAASEVDTGGCAAA